jgi:hypothetical protein
MHKYIILQFIAIMFLNNCAGQENRSISVQKTYRETGVEGIHKTRPEIGKAEVAPGLSFRFTAKRAMATVVHVKAHYSEKVRSSPYFL